MDFKLSMINRGTFIIKEKVQGFGASRFALGASLFKLRPHETTPQAGFKVQSFRAE